MRFRDRRAIASDGDDRRPEFRTLTEELAPQTSSDSDKYLIFDKPVAVVEDSYSE